jgi:hypothetical protein
MVWLDTSVTPALLKMRNAANDAWVSVILGPFASQAQAETGTDTALALNSLRVAQAIAAQAGPATRGYIFGLTLANNAVDANNDIDIAAGVAASDDASPVLMALGATLTKRLDAAWAVGDGNGGLDTGSKANSTWYYVWLIRRPDTGVVDALFSASSTAPTLPANYTQKRLIGFVLTNGSGNIRAFVQQGDDYVWGELLSAQVTLSTTVLTTISLAVPPIGNGVRAYISGAAFNPSVSFSMWLGDGAGVNVAAGPGTNNRIDIADISVGSYGYVSKSLMSSSAASFSVRTNGAGVVLTYSTNSFAVDRRLL